jgi:hypothetical protein
MFTTKSFLATYNTVLALESSATKLTGVEDITNDGGITKPGFLVICTDFDDDRAFIKHLESVVNNAVANVMSSIGPKIVPDNFKSGIVLVHYPDVHVELHRTELQFVHNGIMYVLIVNYFRAVDDIQDIEIVVHLRAY